MLTIWGRSNSINVMKVLWACEEVGADYTRIDAGMQHAVVDDPGFLAMNPNGRVPVINDDGFVLWESNAIVRYLAYKYALGSLYPGDVRARAVAEQWMDWQQTAVAPPLAYPFMGLVRRHAAFRDTPRLQRAAVELNRLWAVVDAHLAERHYLLGDSLTMADIPLGAAAWRWANLPIPRDELPHLADWQRRLADHEGYCRHVMVPLS